MNTVSDSTGLDDQNRARCEGSELWGRTKALLDRLDYLEAQPAQQTQAMRQVKIDRAQGKDQTLQAAITLVLDIKRKPLARMGWKDRASFIREQLERTPMAWGLPDDYADTAREKDIRVIRAVLHEWEEINGLSHKSEPHE